jgi:hypothetical protein
MPSEKAPETLLAENIAGVIADAHLGVYREATLFQAGEHGILIDQEFPTTIPNCTLIVPQRPTSEGRANVLYRVQLIHRLAATAGMNAADAARAHAHAVASLFDHQPYTPPVLGISWAEEYSRTDPMPDTQDRVVLSQNLWFRGRRP